MKSIALTVTNDLNFDQRMNRICSSLSKAGYEVTLIGRKRKHSMALADKGFKMVRLNCVAEKGKFFYLEYNIRLLLYFFRHRFDILCAIDLDTIIPVCLWSAWRETPFVYDAHEYFTGMEEVVSRPMIKKIWQKIEKWAIPKTDMVYTVSEGYAKMFQKKYAKRFRVIRNVPVLRVSRDNKCKKSFILYQGAVNVGRGLEPLIMSMKNIDAQLHICGKGDVFDDLNNLVRAHHLEDKVNFHGYVQPDELFELTRQALVGITFFTNKGLSNQYSLANRFFDYIHAAVPQVAMNYPEYRNFNDKHEVALLIEDLDVETITSAINKLLSDHSFYNKLVDNCIRVREIYCWQNEEKKLLELYDQIR